MTYKHKKGKCSKETKEILEDVLHAKEEVYGCLDCVETIHLRNPMEKVLKENGATQEMKSQAASIINEAKAESEQGVLDTESNLETYQPPEDVKVTEENGAKQISDKEKKKRAYIEFKKDYAG